MSTHGGSKHCCCYCCSSLLLIPEVKLTPTPDSRKEGGEPLFWDRFLILLNLKMNGIEEVASIDINLSDIIIVHTH